MILILAACVENDTGGDLATDTSAIPTAALTAQPGTSTATFRDPSATVMLRPTSIASPTPSERPAAVSVAIERAAMDRDVSPSSVQLLTFEEETWASTALGCPEPGRSYAQIVTSGYSVALNIQGQQVVYHVDRGGRAVVECKGVPVGP